MADDESMENAAGAQPERDPTQQRKRDLTVWWGSGGIALVAAIIMGTTTAVLSAGVESDLSEEYDAAYAADARITAAHASVESMPDDVRAERHFSEVSDAADQVVGYQEDLTSHGKPRTKDDNGNDLDEDEIQTQEEADAQLWDGARSGLNSLFVRVRENSDSGEVTLRDERQVDTWCAETGDDPVGEWSWTGGQQVRRGSTTHIPVTWELHDDDGALVCSVSADWISSDRVFDRPVITVVDGQDLLATEDESGKDAADDKEPEGSGEED